LLLVENLVLLNIMLQCSLEVVSQKDEQVVTKMPSGFSIPVNEGRRGGN
jgi:hypothetical protein